MALDSRNSAEIRPGNDDGNDEFSHSCPISLSSRTSRLDSKFSVPEY
jgi:hypothetical protein